MKQFDNIFFVLTPIQLVNAYEARSFFNIVPENCLLIILAEYPTTLTQLKSILLRQKWPNILYLFDELKIDASKVSTNAVLNGLRILKNIRKCNKVLKANKNASFLFIGNIDNQYMYYSACRLPNAKVVLLDEGNNTIIRMHRNSDVNSRQFIAGPLSNNKKNIVFKILSRGKYLLKNRVSFFSVFQNLCNDSSIGYYKNDYQSIRNLYRLVDKKIVDEVWFLGSPVVGLNMVDKEQYFNLLTEIKKQFDVPFTYIQHRAERKDHLPALPIKLFDLPVEFELITQAQVPKYIISFHSGAAINIYRLFAGNINVINYYLTEKELKTGFVREGRKKVYEYYSLNEVEGFDNRYIENDKS